MNGCPGTGRVQEALDGRLPVDEAESILAHAAGCAACSPLVREHRSLRDAFRSAPSKPSSRCPSAELLSAFAAGTPRDEGVVAHLADCAACREDVVEVRALLREKGRTEHLRASFRSRLHALMPRRSRELAWIGAAAAAVFVAFLAFTLLGRRGEIPVADPPKPAPRMAKEPPAPETPKVPAPAPEPEKPAPVFVNPDKPSVPAVEKPAPEPPRRTPPPPAPEIRPPSPPVEPKPAPAPPKTEPTREKPRIAGTVMAVAGVLSTRPEGDAAWQPARVSQPRDFAGAVELRADLNPVKLKLGPHTLLLQRRTELSVALEEGATRVRLSKGEAVFDVAAGKGAFSVQTATASVAVAGTRFLVAGDADETEVVVQRGSVELGAAGKSVRIGAAERSVAPAGKPPGSPAKADLAKRLQWTRALEETLAVEAELMALQKGMVVLPDPAASGGRAIGVKGQVAAGAEASAEARIQVKQAVPYAVWLRLHWNHGVAPAFSLQVHDQPKWDGRHVAAKPGWQWVRAGAYDLPADPFRVRVADPQGGVRVDRILVTSDPEDTPE